MRSVLVFVLVFLLSVFLLHYQIEAGGRGLNWYYDLKQSGQSTVGRITRTEPSNHEAAYYSFRVGENTYSGEENGNSLSLGSEVRVTYLPSDPSISSLRDPGVEFREQIVFLVIAALLIASAVTVLLWFNRRRATT